VTERRPSFRIVEDPAQRCAARLAEAAGAGGHIALTGGSSPRDAYEQLAAMEVDWRGVSLWWGDERCVPPDDPDSNERLGREALLERVGAANAVYPMRCEEGPDPYQQRVARVLRGQVLERERDRRRRAEIGEVAVLLEQQVGRAGLGVEQQKHAVARR